jgi:NAD(P)-dependent dehydrogenase (short-subunit alcohol dehydrogenase family)
MVQGLRTKGTVEVDSLKNRVAIITGAGRGIGREHALLFAKEGAKVVVNELGGGMDGAGSDITPAQEVVDEIEKLGGEAIANYDDVADWDGAQHLINQAIETYGDLHILVNNAGILRDRMLTNMSEEEWDAIMRVHLKGHFCTTRWAASYWKDQAKQGIEVARSVVNTSSTSGLFGNQGQTNYGAAKTGIATFSIIADAELRRYGVRVNAIAPAAATRLTGTVSSDPNFEIPKGDEWSQMHPANISPFVAYLSTDSCPIHGRVFFVYGGEVFLFQPFTIVDSIAKEGFWTVDELQREAAKWGDLEFDLGHPIGAFLRNS